MATYYVRTNGNDTTGNGSSGTPWKTVYKAYTTISAGDTVNIGDGTYPEDNGGYLNLTGKTFASETIFQSETGSASSVIITGASSSSFNTVFRNVDNITFKNLTFSGRSGISTGNTLYCAATTQTSNIHFENCRILSGDSVGAALFYNLSTGAASAIGYNFKNCYFSQLGTTNPEVEMWGVGSNIRNWTFDTCLFDTTGYIQMQGCQNVTFTNSSAIHRGWQFDAPSSSSIFITDCKASGSATYAARINSGSYISFTNTCALTNFTNTFLITSGCYLTFDGTYLNNPTAANTAFNITGGSNITIKNSTNGSLGIFLAIGGVGNATISNNNIQASGNVMTVNAGASNIAFSGNTVTSSGNTVFRQLGSASNLSFTGETYRTPTSSPLSVGASCWGLLVDSCNLQTTGTNLTNALIVAASASTGFVITNASVKNSVIESMTIGFGVDGMVVDNVDFSVVKNRINRTLTLLAAKNVEIKNSIIAEGGLNTIYMQASTGINIHDNTFYYHNAPSYTPGTTNPKCFFGLFPNAGGAKFGTITFTRNKILVTGLGALYQFYTNADSGGCLFDYNSYDIQGAGLFGWVGDSSTFNTSNKLVSLPALQAAWAASGSPLNDANSTVTQAVTRFYKRGLGMRRK